MLLALRYLSLNANQEPWLNDIQLFVKKTFFLAFFPLQLSQSQYFSLFIFIPSLNSSSSFFTLRKYLILMALLPLWSFLLMLSLSMGIPASIPQWFRTTENRAATRSSIRSFTHTAHSFTCSALLASLTRSTELICSLTHSLLSSSGASK